jgi:5-hydroxyisourate hydrolase-like protein (transthyretin family)
MHVAWLGFLFLMLQLQAPDPAPNANNLRVTGTVVDAVSGAPVKAAEVFLTRGQTTFTVLTQQDGRFVFENLESGKYSLSARGKGYQMQAFDQHENFSTAIVAGVDQYTENLVFRLTPAASISGQVMDEFSEGVRDAQVMLFWEGITDGRQAVRTRNQTSTDDQGRYRFADLQPGRYYLAVHAQPWYAQHNTLQFSDANVGGTVGLHPIAEQNASLDVVYPVTYYPHETEAARASMITLQPGDRANADVTLQPVPALHLRFAVRGTDPPQGVGIQVMQQAFGGLPIFANAQIVSMDKDSIEVAGIPPGHLLVHLDMHADLENRKGNHSLQQEIDATHNGTVNLTEITDEVAVSGKVEVTGTVGLPDSAGIMFRSVETGLNYFANISKEVKNEFQIADVKPGRYHVLVANAPGFYVDTVQAAGATVSGNIVAIGSATQVRLTVRIGQGLGRVEGFALRDAKPAAGVMILLIPNQSQDHPFRFRRDQSDSDGSFTLQEVLPGRYTLVAIENGWNQQWADPAVFKQWVSGGEAVQVAPNGKYTVKVKVQ